MPVTNSVPPPSKRPAAAPADRKAAGLTRARQEALTSLGGLAQIPLMATRQYADAATIGQYWPGVSAELASLAETEESIAKVIDPLIRVGPYSGIIMAVLPMVIQLAVNHKAIPAGTMGSVPPEALSAQLEASVANAQLLALREQQAAEHAARDLRAQIEKERSEFESFANSTGHGPGEPVD